MTSLEIMIRVMELAPEERERAIGELCAGDAALEREVRELLAIDDAGTDFLEDSPATDLFEAPEAPPPERVGAFEITGVIGEGGFGVVYKGVQREPVERRVAIKLIRPGMDSPAMLRRFSEERRLLARLEHPNIARFIDAGLTRASEGAPARPYFVLELVEGPTIAAYARERELPLDRTLALFLQVCAAVQHAHARGLIHRDIKPANALVSEREGEAVCKVIDFGIAKAMGRGADPGVTIRGVPMGTPQYMSPEQARGEGDIDTRTDVYALGALLYELLSGRAPFQDATAPGSSPSVVLRLIEETEPKHVSEALAKRPHGRFEASRLRDELDWIVSRAMEKSRERRYQTVVELTQDLVAFLRGLPVSARPPSRAYRVSKFVARHRSGVIAGGVAGAAVIGGTVAAVWFGVAAESARQREAGQRVVAERNAERVEGINAFLLEDLFYAVEGSELGPDATLVELVDRAAPGVEERFGDDPTMLARVYSLLGSMRHKLTRPQDAIDDFTRGIEMLDQAQDLTPVQRATLYSGRAHAYHLNGELERALEDADRSIRELDPGGSPDWSAHPALASLKGIVLSSMRRYDEAEPLIRVAIVTYGKDPEKHADALTRVTSHRLSMLSAQQRYSDLLEQADELKEMSAHLEGNARLVNLHLSEFWRSQALLRLDRREEAVESMLAMIEPGTLLFGHGSYMHASTLAQAGSSLCQVGRGDEGVPMLLEAIPMMESHFGPHHYEVERMMGTLCARLKELGRDNEYRAWRTRHMLLRLYVAGPGETESVRAVSREAVELLGLDGWDQAMEGEAESLTVEHPKRARFNAHVVVALEEVVPADALDGVRLLELSLGAVEGLAQAERPEEVRRLVWASIMPRIERDGTPEQARRAGLLVGEPEQATETNP